VGEEAEAAVEPRVVAVLGGDGWAVGRSVGRLRILSADTRIFISLVSVLV